MIVTRGLGRRSGPSYLVLAGLGGLTIIEVRDGRVRVVRIQLDATKMDVRSNVSEAI